MSDVAALLAGAENLISEGRHKEAHGLCLRALALSPDEPLAFYLLGAIANEHQAYAKAIELFERALQRADEARIHAQYARALSHMHRPAEASAAAERALAHAPEDPYTLDTIGVALSRAGQHEAALTPFSRAVARAPDVASYAFNYAASLQFSGRFAEAEAAYRDAVKLDPNAWRALAAIPHLRRQSRDDNLIPALTEAFERADAAHRLHLGHALAKTLDDMAEYEESFRWLIAAKIG
ncbi:MAG: tetratricopeptide repeat protein, partial [Hyphomonadaceae bacterium]|nr:tetratricopeptide repeat protein [Hyphomonadaceae bacterium]